MVRVHNDLLLGGQGTHSILVLLDLSSAFDTLDHSKLLQTLMTSYGIKGPAINWFRSYLLNRQFSVKVRKTKSGSYYITIGVPQGSILGPLLFIMFTKDLELIAQKYNFSLHCYADDCQLYFSLIPNNNTCDVAQISSALSACLLEI